MSYSPLATKFIYTPKMHSPRNHAKDTITPHYVVGYVTAEEVATYLRDDPDRTASANYYIGRIGDIVCGVDEDNRSWCSSSSANDNRAITIECANYMDTGDGHVYGQLPDATWKSLVALCADICKRNGKRRLVYRGRADYAGLASDEMLLTMHKWFKDTDCPGPWLSNQFSRLANEVNAILSGGKGMTRICINDKAARIHYDMATDSRNGYSQGDRWGGQYGLLYKTVSTQWWSVKYLLGDYDCASSVIRAWQLALVGTKYEGALDGATYTGDIERVFLASGLFTSSLSPARRGDLYLTAKTATRRGHVAMCQDGGSDGILGYDALSEFNRNERGGATGGKAGDQDGGESVVRGYYDYQGGWQTVLHYNGKADYEIGESVAPKQKTTNPKNDLGIKYRAHSAKVGWLPSVRDGQDAGTEGYAASIEALKITPPEGMVLDAYAHVQGIGNLYFDGIRKGASSGTGSSATDPIIGTTGQARRMEALRLVVTKWPDSLKGKRLRYQGHVEGIGWMDPVSEGQWCGTRGQRKRLECVRIWFE